MSDHCPTCGSPVRVVSSDEGTSCYVPETDAGRVLARWHCGHEVRTGQDSPDCPFCKIADLMSQKSVDMRAHKWPYTEVLTLRQQLDALRRAHDVLREWVSRVATSHVVPEFRERAQEVLAEADKAREGLND